MKQKPINEIEEASANKTIATFASLAGMAEMKAVIGMIARDAARNTTLSLRNEGYFSEPAKEAPKTASKPQPKTEADPQAEIAEVLDKVVSMFEEAFTPKDALDAARLAQLVGMLFKKP
jgi:tRNA-dihydrouridine synthase